MSNPGGKVARTACRRNTGGIQELCDPVIADAEQWNDPTAR